MKKIFILLTAVMLIASLFVSCNSSASPAAVNYTVKFIDGDVVYDLQTVSAGEKINEPLNVPLVDGYVFAGWKKPNANSEDDEWNFETDVVTRDTELCAKWNKLYPVGGRIFLERNINNGLMYTFYTSKDKDREVVPYFSIEDLGAAKYYTIEGIKLIDIDNYFVYDNETRNAETTGGIDSIYADGGLASGKYWGWNLVFCEAYHNEFLGDGRENTELIIGKGGKGVPLDYSPNIWQYAYSCRVFEVGGCNDWYVPTMLELDELYKSGLEPDWFASKKIWTSVEGGVFSAYYRRTTPCWGEFGVSNWEQDVKCDWLDPLCVVLIRSF